MTHNNKENINVTDGVDMIYEYWQKIGGGNADNLKDFMEIMVRGVFNRYIYEQLTQKPYGTYNPNNPN